MHRGGCELLGSSGGECQQGLEQGLRQRVRATLTLTYEMLQLDTPDFLPKLQVNLSTVDVFGNKLAQHWLSIFILPPFLRQ